MIVILSDDDKQDIGKQLYEHIKRKTEQVHYISVSNLKINTCYNCGYCLTKEYRKCVLKDDVQKLLYEVGKSTHLVLVSPLTWGSYSSKIKKIFDRLAVLGDIHYHVVNGELVKGVINVQKSIWGIGIKDQCSLEEKALFNQLVEENRKIMNISGKGIVIGTNPPENELEKLAEVIVHA